MITYEGKLIGKGLRIAIVVSRFNSFITERLLDGALDALRRVGVSENDIIVSKVPGAFEIPLCAKDLAKTGRFDGIVCLGAVIRGETPHFDYVCKEVSKGIGKVSLDEEIPLGFGIITADTIEQAIDRAGTKAGNKGFSAALSVVEMANLRREIIGKEKG